MSTGSSFREALGRPAATGGERQGRSGIRARYLLTAAGEIGRPVEVARELTRHGVSLRKAHAALDRVAQRLSAAVEVEGADGMVAALAGLNVRARQLAVPDVTVRQVREGLNLSQAEFATQFGLELRTIQNWEQDRHGLDATARVLLAVIEQAPHVVEIALTARDGRGGKP